MTRWPPPKDCLIMTPVDSRGGSNASDAVPLVLAALNQQDSGGR